MTDEFEEEIGDIAVDLTGELAPRPARHHVALGGA